MKKLVAAMLCIGIYTTAKSQVYVQGGLNLANITETKSGETQNNKTLTTFQAGILGRFRIADPLAFETGLLLQGRGSKANTYLDESNKDDNYVKARFNPLYIELPASLVFRLPVGEDKSNLFIQAGPYVAMGVGGKSTVDTKFLGTETHTTSDIKFNNDDPATTQQEDAAYDKLKRFDYGINVGAGVDVGKLLLKVNYGLGLAKINSMETNNSSDDKNKYRTLSISLGIPITGRK